MKHIYLVKKTGMWKLAGNCQILFQIEKENGVMTELDTFLQTFRKLWKYGLDGHLYVECKAGPAWLGLHLPLGNSPGPVHGPLEKVKRNSVTGRRRLRCEAEKNGHFTKFNTKEAYMLHKQNQTICDVCHVAICRKRFFKHWLKVNF